MSPRGRDALAGEGGPAALGGSDEPQEGGYARPRSRARPSPSGPPADRRTSRQVRLGQRKRVPDSHVLKQKLRPEGDSVQMSVSWRGFSSGGAEIFISSKENQTPMSGKDTGHPRAPGGQENSKLRCPLLLSPSPRLRGPPVAPPAALPQSPTGDRPALCLHGRV